MSFGANLKKLRQDNNLTQEELAKKVNTSRSNIANYENDKNMPSVDMLEKLSKILNCTTDYLLGKTDIRKAGQVNIDETDIAFASGIKGLNETNKAIIKSTIEGLLAKQKLDEENKK